MDTVAIYSCQLCHCLLVVRILDRLVKVTTMFVLVYPSRVITKTLLISFLGLAALLSLFLVPTYVHVAGAIGKMSKWYE